MKVFLWEEKQFFEVNRKEELDNNTYIISDEEEHHIRNTMDNGGVLWLNNREIKWSGVKPDEISIWNNKEKKWEISQDLYDARHEKRIAEMWEKIKKKRYQEIHSDVYLSSVDKWFQTDESSMITYSHIGNNISLDIYKPIEWKTVDNSFITLTVDIFKELQILISENTQKQYQVSEIHKTNMINSQNPLEYDFVNNWNNV